MERVFTAVGSIIHMEKDGRGIIRQGEEIKELSSREMAVWMPISRDVKEYDTLWEQYMSLAHGEESCCEDDFPGLLNRLMRRGLLMSGEGHTLQEASYDLLSKAVIVPRGVTLREKLHDVRQALKHLKLRGLLHYVIQIKPIEREVHKLAGVAKLTLAEVLCYKENGSLYLPPNGEYANASSKIQALHNLNVENGRMSALLRLYVPMLMHMQNQGSIRFDLLPEAMV